MGVEQATQDTLPALLLTMQVSHDHESAGGANSDKGLEVVTLGWRIAVFTGSLLDFATGLAEEHAMHFPRSLLFCSMQVSHSQEPVSGANCAFKVVLRVGGGAEGLDVDAGINPHSGEDAVEEQDGLGLRQATHF